MKFKVLQAIRNWGSEYIIYVAPSFYTVKILSINAGHRGGLQFHHLKHECGLVLEGKLIVRVPDQSVSGNFAEIVLEKGAFFAFKPLLLHQEEAVEDTYILEISSPHFNDRVRLDHTENPHNSLETTSLEDVYLYDGISDVADLLKFGFVPVDENKIPRVLRLVSFF
jgi:mannose-6-phosphate isomerase